MPRSDSLADSVTTAANIADHALRLLIGLVVTLLILLAAGLSWWLVWMMRFANPGAWNG